MKDSWNDVHIILWMLFSFKKLDCIEHECNILFCIYRIYIKVCAQLEEIIVFLYSYFWVLRYDEFKS